MAHACCLGEPAPAGEVLAVEGEHAGVPSRLYFVPHAKALMFYKSVKAGFLLGVEQGSGFVIARLGDALSNRWSAPAFVKVTGVELGLVGGMDRAETLVGVMSDKALDALIGSRGKFNMSSNWNFEITPLEDTKEGGANPSWIFNADFTSASISKGVMADVGLQGTRITWDTAMNEHCYGRPAAQILRGEVEPPPELAAMADKLALCCAPQMAGVRGATAEPAPAPTATTAAPAATPPAAATTYTTTTTTTVPAEGAVLGGEGPAVVTPMR
ncbi:actin cortical patch component Lsb4 isoform A [Chlorella sorokiniana]|uniref:Actin cortical patch component Lsb4 isoform A n=1 Tax=Chlorella sorokiniana TaxID=3076 RepID=A0A2P6U225_CHLSO|nr:actin cortical patch component Lsb4 isoform A [Chlorella sorokiniana]|eukprot:PRW60350.1 actin cortical patch component Lsb4 isoform A [Chlorella sorokiniana]